MSLDATMVRTLGRTLVGAAVAATVFLQGWEAWRLEGWKSASSRSSRVSGASTQAAPRAESPSRLTTPKEEWGHNVGDDYFLANYEQLLVYWRRLETRSRRIRVVEIGRTSEDRPMVMAIITAPGNHLKIARFKEISQRLANAEGLSEAQARALANEGKAVVWIDGGLHASEVLGAQQLIETVWQLVSRNDAETTRFLNDVIVLCTLVNPDGMGLVSDWYMKYGGTTGNTPVLYNHYAGHDNNRDFYMSATAESTNINRVLYREWYPQIVYNHHQAGPAGTVMFAAPFRDPYNYFQHPYAIAAIDAIGAAMQERFMVEGKPGVTSRRGASYSTWFNGGLRTTAHFHNMIGILTETVGNPTPASIPFVASRQIADTSLYWPIAPQAVWHFRQSIEYSITANRAVLDYASRYREKLLYDIYKMGRDEIRWGSEDHWTFTPHKTARVQAELVAKGVATPTPIPGAASTMAAAGQGPSTGSGQAPSTSSGRAGNVLYAALTAKELRDPRGFILPADQPDFGTATRFVNALMKTGITVLRASAPFAVAGKQYPANSYVVKTAQAFRPHVLDMFEPQDHPDDIPYPGGPPTAPYDAAGYTLAFQMGVQFDRILDAFEGPFVKLNDVAKVPAGVVKTAQGTPAGYYFTHQANNSFIVVNRLLAANEEVSWLPDGPLGAGTFYVAAKSTTRGILEKAAGELGVSFEPASSAPAAAGARLRKLRIGLVDRYGGGMPAGWTRLIFRDFEFPFEEGRDDLFGPDINAGNLRARYDVLVFNNESLGPSAGQGAGAGGTRGAGAGPGAPRASGDDRPLPLPIPEKYARRQGAITAQGVTALRQFVEDGGTIVAIGSGASSAVQQLGLPLRTHLVKSDGSPLGNTEYYVPGSVLRVAVDNMLPVAHGLPAELDVYFNNSPVWKLDAASASVVRIVATFPNDHPLRSGWAWGERHLEKGVEMAEVSLGKGRVVLFGNELLFRSQPHGNFKLFFNALYLSVAGL